MKIPTTCPECGSDKLAFGQHRELIYLGCEYCNETILDRLTIDDISDKVFPITREEAQTALGYAGYSAEHSIESEYWCGVRDTLLTMLGDVTEVRMTGPGENNAAYAILVVGKGDRRGT